MDKIVKKAKYYSIKAHNKVNHKYDGKNYSYHLEMVYDFGVMFIHLLPKEIRPAVKCALWGHDRIEDCRETYNDIKKYYGEDVADIIYGVTDYRGKNREERKPKELYIGMLKDIRVKFVKIADRLANIKHSHDVHFNLPENKRNNTMYTKYKKEAEGFKKKLYLSSNLREMSKVMGFWKGLKSFKYYGFLKVMSDTIKNRQGEPLQPMWDLMDTLQKD